MASESTETQQRLRPDVLNTALLDEIAERLFEIKELAAAEVPAGITEPIGPIAVTSLRRRVTVPIKPWFSVIAINDGPDPVWAIVNTERSFEPHQILEDETYNVDFHRGLILDTLFWCDPGQTASVRLVGVR